MPTEDKQRVLRYKTAVTFQGVSIDLQVAVKNAIKTLGSDVDNREQEVVIGGSTRRVLSGVIDSSNMLVGRLMQYTPGQKQHYLVKDEAKGDFILDTTPAPKNGKAKRGEFVESILYFAIFKAHVCFIGSQSLGSKHLEDHLNWLLRHKTSELPGEDMLFLRDQPSSSAMESIAKHPVASVEIGAELDFEPVHEVPAKRKTKGSDRVEGYKMVQPTGSIAEALTMLFGEWFGDAPLKLALKRQERVEFKLLLKYVSKKKTDQGFELMEKFAVAGRHFDQEDCRIKLHKAGVIKGDQLKIELPMTVTVQESGLIDEFGLWSRIYSWLLDAIKNARVPA